MRPYDNKQGANAVLNSVLAIIIEDTPVITLTKCFLLLYPLQNYSQIYVRSEVLHVQQVLVLKRVKIVAIGGTKQNKLYDNG
jgi:hypothetical protein